MMMKTLVESDGERSVFPAQGGDRRSFAAGCISGAGGSTVSCPACWITRLLFPTWLEKAWRKRKPRWEKAWALQLPGDIQQWIPVNHIVSRIRRPTGLASGTHGAAGDQCGT